MENYEVTQSKLVILNGPLGIGKSTLARRYADEHPLTLRLDIDDIRTYISHWRERADESARLSKAMALDMAQSHLNHGYDVVVPQIIRSIEFIEQFGRIALETHAKLVEVLLFANKDEAIRRFKERNYAQGYRSGFRPGLIDSGGRETKLASMYDEMLAVAKQRPNTIYIEPVYGEEEATYRKLLTAV